MSDRPTNRRTRVSSESYFNNNTSNHFSAVSALLYICIHMYIPKESIARKIHKRSFLGSVCSVGCVGLIQRIFRKFERSFVKPHIPPFQPSIIMVSCDMCQYHKILNLCYIDVLLMANVPTLFPSSLLGKRWYKEMFLFLQHTPFTTLFKAWLMFVLKLLKLLGSTVLYCNIAWNKYYIIFILNNEFSLL